MIGDEKVHRWSDDQNETIEDEEEFDPESLYEMHNDAYGAFPPFIEFIQAASLRFFWFEQVRTTHGKWQGIL